MGGGNEAFAINYGSVGISTEIWANRMQVGPAWDALDAKFEEFFLSSWVGGDPALIVDMPANAPKPGATPATKPAATGAAKPKEKDQPDCPPSGPTAQNQLQTGPKATAAFYPDDPSNVYHSYLNDRVKFRVMHGGANVCTSTTSTPTSGCARRPSTRASSSTARRSRRATASRWR